MTELKPCPFCGGEVKPYNYWEKTIIECEDCEKYGHGAYVVARTESEAIDAWNTRAERTCHVERSDCFECSECVFFDAYAAPSDFTYCPQCGAKVVS